MRRVKVAAISSALFVGTTFQSMPAEATNKITFKASVNVTFKYAEQATLKKGQSLKKSVLAKDALSTCKEHPSLKSIVIKSASGKKLIDKPSSGTAFIKSAKWNIDANGESKYEIDANCNYSLIFNLSSLLSSGFYKFSICGRYCDIESPRYTAAFLQKQKTIQMTLSDISLSGTDSFPTDTWTEPPSPSVPTFKVSECMDTRLVYLQVTDPIFNNSVFWDWKIKVDRASQIERSGESGRFAPANGNWEFNKDNIVIAQQTTVNEVPFDLILSQDKQEFRFKYVLLPGCQGVKKAS